MISCSIIAQELVKYSPNSFQLMLSIVSKSAPQHLLFVNLVLDVLLPSGKHGTCLTAIVPQKVVSNLPMSFLDSQIIDLLELSHLL